MRYKYLKADDIMSGSTGDPGTGIAANDAAVLLCALMRGQVVVYSITDGPQVFFLIILTLGLLKQLAFYCFAVVDFRKRLNVYTQSTERLNNNEENAAT